MSVAPQDTRRGEMRERRAEFRTIPGGKAPPGGGGGPPSGGPPEKLLPQNIEAEAGVLGAILIDPDTLDEVAPFLAAEDFYRETNRTIYQAALDLRAVGKPADLIILCDELERTGRLDDVGGRAGVAALANQVPTSRNARYYAEIVQRQAILRRLIHAAGQIAGVAYDEPDADLALIEAQRLVYDLADVGQPQTRFHLKTIREMRLRPKPTWLVPGILQERKLGLIYGETNTGKSFYGLDMGLRLSIERGEPVIYVCSEGADGILPRVDAWLAQHGYDDAPDFYIVDESPNLLERGDVEAILAQAKTLDTLPIAVFFDTLASSMEGGDENSPEDMGIAVGAMKRVQRELGAAVVCVHHSGKDTTRGPRGNSLLKAAVDVAVEIVKDEQGYITARCKKAKDAPYFPDAVYRLRSVPLDDYPDFPPCVIEPTDGVRAADTTKKPQLAKSAQHLLSILRQFPSGDTKDGLKARWVKASGMHPRSFDNALDALIDTSLIEYVGGCYRLIIAASPGE